MLAADSLTGMVRWSSERHVLPTMKMKLPGEGEEHYKRKKPRCGVAAGASAAITTHRGNQDQITNRLRPDMKPLSYAVLIGVAIAAAGLLILHAVGSF